MLDHLCDIFRYTSVGPSLPKVLFLWSTILLLSTLNKAASTSQNAYTKGNTRYCWWKDRSWAAKLANLEVGTFRGEAIANAAGLGIQVATR